MTHLLFSSPTLDSPLSKPVLGIIDTLLNASLYIYDRQCSCIFYHSFAGHSPPTKLGSTTLPNVVYPSNSNPISTASTSTTGSRTSGVGATVKAPWSSNNTSTNGLVDDQNGQANEEMILNEMNNQTKTVGSLPFDEESKLIYGIVFSLRHLVKKLTSSQKDSSDAFHSYSTTKYKLHYLHTLTNYHFVLISSPRQDSLRTQLNALYSGPFLDHVIRNPLVELDSTKGTGIDNLAFRNAVDKTLGIL